MALPGLLIGYVLFGLCAAVVLGLCKTPGLRPATFVAFVFSAHIGLSVYTIFFVKLLADSHHRHLSSSDHPAIFLGMPVAVVLSGWGGAHLISWFLNKPKN